MEFNSEEWCAKVAKAQSGEKLLALLKELPEPPPMCSDEEWLVKIDKAQSREELLEMLEELPTRTQLIEKVDLEFICTALETASANLPTPTYAIGNVSLGQ